MQLDEFQAKVILLGDSDSGKSSLINQYKTGKFNSELESTISASFCSRSIKINGKKLNLSIWDTAGQERFGSISSLYSRNSNAVILVTDACKDDGFASIDKWYNKTVKNVLPEQVLIYIAINKCDIVSKEKDFNDILLYAQSLRAKVFVTSAKDGTNVQELFAYICASLMSASIDLSSRSFKLALTENEGGEAKRKESKCCG